MMEVDKRSSEPVPVCQAVALYDVVELVAADELIHRDFVVEELGDWPGRCHAVSAEVVGDGREAIGFRVGAVTKKQVTGLVVGDEVDFGHDSSFWFVAQYLDCALAARDLLIWRGENFQCSFEFSRGRVPAELA